MKKGLHVKCILRPENYPKTINITAMTAVRCVRLSVLLKDVWELMGRGEDGVTAVFSEIVMFA